MARGIGHDREEASLGIGVTSCFNSCCLFSSNLVFPSKQKDQAWALPGSLAVYRVVLRGSEEASNLDW